MNECSKAEMFQLIQPLHCQMISKIKQSDGSYIDKSEVETDWLIRHLVMSMLQAVCACCRHVTAVYRQLQSNSCCPDL